MDSINIPITFNHYYTTVQTNVYNYLIGSYTKILYQDLLNTIPENSHILDIGIGNGCSLVENFEIIKNKNIKIDGIDIDPGAIFLAKSNIKDNDLENLVTAECIDINKIDDKQYDYIFFSNSFSVIDNITDILKDVKDRLLKENGKIVISTTIEAKDDKIKSTIKENAKKLVLGIDFGKLITICDFVNKINDVNMKICNMKLVYNTWYPIWGHIHVYTFFIN